MTVAIVGSGRFGRAVERALAERGVSARMFSRSTGFDVTQDGTSRSFGDVDVVVEATDIFTTKRGVATEFFTRSTRAVSAAARASGTTKHILISIVNCEKPAVQGYGYFAAKAEQERVARSVSPDLTVVRSTQWFEFAQQNLERMKFGPVAIVPTMTIQPVALDTVARVVADCSVGERSQTQYDVAGPDVMTLWEMTKALPQKAATPVPVRVPGAAGRAFRAGAMVPGREAEILGPRFVDWLAESVHTRGQ